MAAGWFLHTTMQGPPNAADAPPVRRDCAKPVNQVEPDPPTRPDVNHDTQDFRDDVDSLRRDLANVQANLDACLAGQGSTWPRDIGDEYRLDAFSDKIDDALAAVNVDGEVELHCEEFPCVAVLPEGTPRQAFQDALKEAYGPGTKVRVLEHSAVGPWGSKVFAMATAVPEGLDEEQGSRADDRCWGLLLDLQKDLVAESREGTQTGE